MKRIFITTLLCFFVSSYINAQLLVDNNGNVRIKNTNSTTNSSYFAINTTGDSTICSYIYSDRNSQSIGLRIMKTDGVNASGNETHTIFSSARQVASSTRKAYGIYGFAYKSSGVDSNCGRSFGVYGIAGNSTPGWNYGVYGTLMGNNNGAGVFGSSVNLDGGIDTQGRYAGFFRGNVKSTDVIYATSFQTSSDYRLKENIESVSYDCVDNIMKLNVVRYNLKPRTVNFGDTAVTQMGYYTNESGILDRIHYGLIAQELQDIYPDLVYEGGDGYLSVNYMELIPLLIQSIQSLKEEVEQLKENQKSSKRTTIKTSNQMGLSSISKISVSVEAATISCNISNSVKKANIFIYDTNGNQLYRGDIKDRGRMEIEIKDFAFNDGIYVCSLLADDNMDSRRFYFGR